MCIYNSKTMSHFLPLRIDRAKGTVFATYCLRVRHVITLSASRVPGRQEKIHLRTNCHSRGEIVSLLLSLFLAPVANNCCHLSIALRAISIFNPLEKIKRLNKSRNRSAIELENWIMLASLFQQGRGSDPEPTDPFHQQHFSFFTNCTSFSGVPDYINR